MLTTRRIKLAVLGLSILAAGNLLTRTGSITEAQKPDHSVRLDQLQRLSHQIAYRDLSVHPPEVRELTAKLLAKPTAAGNAVLLVRFAKEEEVPPAISIQLEDKIVTFHDDGKDGDERAGDGIHSAITTINAGEVQKDQRRVAAIKADSVPVFRGRELFTLNKIEKRVTQFRPGLPINLFPVGDPDNIDPERSLMVRDPAVVQDPSRTRTSCGSGSMGKWSFGYLMQQMANQPLTGIAPEAFVLRWLKRWKTNQTVNDWNVAARSNINTLITNWPKNGDGTLDLNRAPFRLLAIVNRADLRGSFSYGGGGSGNGGELRFVFAVLNPTTCATQPFTVIFEFGVKKNNCVEMRNWAQQWKNLDSLALGTPAYNNALEAITEQIVKSGAGPGKPNGSALNQLRTNERSIGTPWELREFQIATTNGGHLEEVTVKQSPDNSLNTTATLASFVNLNEPAVLMDRHTVPLSFGPSSDPFRGGSSPVPGDNNNFRWTSATITNLEARHHFSLQTCNSCHAGETQTSVFTHVEVAGFGGGPAQLSRFLRGSTPSTTDNEFFSVTDPFNSNVRQFNDLRRRATDLDALINTPCIFQFAIKPIAMVH